MRVAIVGAGPSGSALAILLARQGARVTLFDDGRRPELLVGESLVPAVIPILQRLGLEEETASFSRVKPGVSFIWSPTDRFSFSFARFAPGVFPYAYNIPRPRFDDAVLARAVACGVERVVAHARLEPVSEGGRDRRVAVDDRRREQARHVRGDVRELPADLATRPRSGLGDARRRVRIRRSDALPRRLPGSSLGRARGRRAGAVLEGGPGAVAGGPRSGAPAVRGPADRDAHRVARSGGDVLRRTDGGAVQGRTRLDGGRNQRLEERGPEPHRAAHRAAGLRDGHVAALQPGPPALHGPLRAARGRAHRDGDPVARAAATRPRLCGLQGDVLAEGPAAYAALDPGEAARLQHTQDLFRRHAIGDRVPVVLHQELSLGAARADAGDAGQDALEVNAEEALAERRARQGDLEDQDAPARLQDPQAFTKRHAEVGHVA